MSRRITPVVGLLAAALLAACEPAPPGAVEARSDGDERAVVFVANAEGGTVTLIDAATLTVLREIDVLPDGRQASLPEDDPVQATVGQAVVEAAGGDNFAQDQDISPDGRTLYVSRGHRGDVAAFDVASGAMLWKTTIGGLRADHMTLSADGRRLFVSALTENVVEVVDTEQGAVIDSFPTGEWPHDNHLSHDGERLYNASIGNIVVPPEIRENRTAAGELLLGVPYQLTIVEADSLVQLASHRFEAGIRPFVVTRDEQTVYLQLSEFHGVAAFDLAAGEMAQRLELPIADGVTEEDYSFEAPHHGLALSPDEATLCLAGRASDYVALVDTKRFEVDAIIPVGDAPSWAINGPDGRHCYVANTRDGTVSVIDYAARSELARIETGLGPKHLEAAFIPADAACGRASPKPVC